MNITYPEDAPTHLQNHGHVSLLLLPKVSSEDVHEEQDTSV